MRSCAVWAKLRYRKLFVCSLLGGLSSALIPLAFWLHTGDSHFFVQGVRMYARARVAAATSQANAAASMRMALWESRNDS